MAACAACRVSAVTIMLSSVMLAVAFISGEGLRAGQHFVLGNFQRGGTEGNFSSW